MKGSKMKGYNDSYQEVEGLNPFTKEIEDRGKSMAQAAVNLGFVARVGGYFATFPEVTSDDVDTISAYSNSVTFHLAVKDSKFVHALAQFTGIKFLKKPAYDGKSIELVGKVPEDHLLATLGVENLYVSNYLPDTCKVVVKEMKPLSEGEIEMYQKLIAEGKPVFGTECGAEETFTEVEVESVQS